MGFFKKAFKRAKSDIAGGLDLLSASFSHPILTFQNPKAAVEKTRKEGAAQTIGRTIRTTALLSGALLLPTKAGISTAAKFVAKKPIIATAGLVGVGAATVSPKARKSIDVLTNPATPFEAGRTIGKVAEGKKVPIKDALLTGGLVGGAAALTGGVIATKGKLPSLKIPRGLPDKDILGSNIPQPSKASIEEPVSTPKKPATAKKEAKPIKVSQNVDINVKSTGITKRFKNDGIVMEL